MALKRSLTSLDDVDEAFHDLYEKQSDGSYQLQVEGDDRDDKLAEFRKNNRTLNAELEKLKKKLKDELEPFEGLSAEDVERYKQLQEELREKEEKDLLKEGKLQEIIDRRIAEATKGHAGEVESRDATIQKLTGRLGQLQIDSAITKAIEATGLKPRQGALDDIMRRARETWRVNDQGEIEPRDPSGNLRLGSDGQRISVEDYVKADLAESAAHLFEAATGGGAGGGKAGGGPDGKLVIDRNDPIAMGKHADKIASGEAVVQ